MAFTFSNWYDRVLTSPHIPFDRFCTFELTLYLKTVGLCFKGQFSGAGISHVGSYIPFIDLRLLHKAKTHFGGDHTAFAYLHSTAAH